MTILMDALLLALVLISWRMLRQVVLIGVTVASRMDELLVLTAELAGLKATNIEKDRADGEREEPLRQTAANTERTAIATERMAEGNGHA